MNRFFKKFILLSRRLRALDWFVILIFICIVIFLTASTFGNTRWITITYKIQITPANITYYGETPPFWVAEKIKPGDVQYDGTGQENLKVIDVKRWGITSKETWVTASVKAKYKPRQKTYTYMYQPLEIGRPIDVVINGTNIRGIVTAIEGSSDTRPTYSIVVKTRLLDDKNAPYSVVTRGIDPWMADTVKIGQTMKDSTGTIVAEILDKEVRPAERVVATNDGKIFVGEDPLKVDAFLTIRLKVTKLDETYVYLEDKPIKVGFSFPIYLNQIFITPTVIQFL